jgi:hypothetical protein
MDEQMKGWAESQLKDYGLEAESWREDADYTEPRPVAVIGRFRVIEDDESYGLYAGDEGEVTANVVGSDKHGNRRLTLNFCPDDLDDGNEVPDLSPLKRI